VQRFTLTHDDDGKIQIWLQFRRVRAARYDPPHDYCHYWLKGSGAREFVMELPGQELTPANIASLMVKHGAQVHVS
jgi:hypothetical protein